jgi:hypothetical protein
MGGLTDIFRTKGVDPQTAEWFECCRDQTLQLLESHLAPAKDALMSHASNTHDFELLFGFRRSELHIGNSHTFILPMSNETSKYRFHEAAVAGVTSAIYVVGMAKRPKWILEVVREGMADQFLRDKGELGIVKANISHILRILNKQHLRCPRQAPTRWTWLKRIILRNYWRAVGILLGRIGGPELLIAILDQQDFDRPLMTFSDEIRALTQTALLTDVVKSLRELE